MGSAIEVIWAALGGAPEWCGRLRMEGVGSLPSVFGVSDLAAASVGAACLAVAELASTQTGGTRGAWVDRRLASLWFERSIRPEGWVLPPVWDAVAGAYRAGDGWVRLHTNAPHHRAAALGVLGVPAERAAVARAVSGWPAEGLEAAVVAAGGCAAAMRSMGAWAAHPQGAAVAAEPLVAWDAGGTGPPVRWGTEGRPLAGVRVLDMTRVLAGPVSTRFLAGFGAEVLRIDPPWWDEPAVVPDMTLGKRCARLDLRQPGDRAVWDELLRGAHVVVHGYRSDALERMGLGAAARAALCPGLVDVSLDAYGWTGPWAGRRGFDSLVQMSSGIAEAGMRAAGGDAPVPLPVQALDHATGYLMAAAVVRGLTERLAGGGGCRARVSLARMAGLLVGMAGDDGGDFAAVESGDLGAGVEMTEWGAARRVRAPGGVDGAGMAWDLAAGGLGRGEAVWVG